MQMYAVVMMGYFVYNNYIKGDSKSSSSSSDSSHDFVEDDDVPSGGASGNEAVPKAARTRRGFSQVEGSWLSYLEAGQGDSMLLMLHSTSLSAEAELSGTISQILEKATSPPPGGLRVLAPDRPCHGYSPCARSSKAGNAGWLESLLASKPKFKSLTIVSSGRAAARQALALARERGQPSQLLLVSPTASGPSRASGALKEAAEARAWLERHAGASSALAAADAARWAASTDADEADDDRLVCTGLPEGSRVSMLYAEGEKEDTDLKEELEGTGLLATSRQLAGAGKGGLAASEAASEAAVEEVWRLLFGGEGADL